MISFLDVGQADAILIRTVDTVILVDTGDVLSSGEQVLAYLKRCRIERIDLLVLTHPHDDHIGGVPAIMEALDVTECLMPELVEATEIFRRTLDALREEGCIVRKAMAGLSLTYGRLTLDVLSPLDDFPYDVNDAGAVVRASFGETSVLLMGDASATLERRLLEAYTEGELKTTLLKVAHHGSDTSTTKAFLAASAPLYAVISCGDGDDYGFPHARVLSRLADAGVRVYRTDTDGTIVFYGDGTQLKTEKAD